MNTRVPKIYHVIPAAYVLFIVVLVFLNFSGESSFNESAGGLRIQGKASSATGRGDVVTEARLEFRGILFLFDGNNVIEVVAENGESFTSAVIGYKAEVDGITVTFERGISLRFRREETPIETLAVSVTLPTHPVLSVSIPFDLKSAYAIDSAGKIPVALVNSGSIGHGSFMSLPVGSHIDAKNMTLELAVVSENTGRILIAERLSPDEEPSAYWFALHVPDIPDPIYRDSISDYLDRSYLGWKSGRFNAANGRWGVADGSDTFSEPLAAAFLAESLARGEFEVSIDQVSAASRQNPGNVTFLSAPFLGNVVDSTQDLQSQDAAKIERVKNLVARRDPSLFEIPDVLAFTADRSPYAIVQEFMQFTSGIDLSLPTVPQCVGIAETWRDGLLFDELISDATHDLERVVTDRILPAIAASRNGLLLLIDDNTSDIALSLRAGAVLLQSEFSKDQEIMRKIGKDLVITALSLADRNGTLPARVQLENSQIESYIDFLDPEFVYQSVSPNPYYPREVSLYQILAPGAWMWTAADIETIVTGSTSYRLRVRFPKDEIHHLVLQGIKPFKSVEMFGRAWVSDPQFQDYYSGWYYNRGTETLFMKIRHREEVEEITFRY